MQAPDFIRDHLAAMLRRLTPELVLGPDSAELLAGAATWLSVPGGNVLFRQGEPSDSVFIVVSGLLAVVMNAPGGGERIIGRLGAGEVVGEMGCIVGQPRTATVKALRSSELLEISWSDIERIASRDPGILLSICRTVVDRMARAQDGRLPAFQPSTFTIVTLGEGADERQFAERFKDALATFGDAFLMTEENGRGSTADDLNRIEKANKYVVYLTDRKSPSWTSRCIRQTDVVLALARGDQPPQPLLRSQLGVGPDIPIVLVLEWDPNDPPHDTAAWIKATGASRHYHVRTPAHIRRVARLLTGNGFGLVLSGGGARGLAHLGVLRALEENKIEIDVIIGTSIGAIIGSAVALEWERDFMHSKIHEFTRVSPLWDLTIPRTSILAGRNVRKSLKRWFGDLQIEDMPMPYGCVSVNLSSGTLAVHRSGDLKTWVRASAALPGVFPPVEVDGQVYVDGGVLNNMPADQIRDSGAGFVLGVDVGAEIVPDVPPVNPVPLRLNLLELLVMVGSIGDGALASTRRKHCDVLLVPDVRSVGLLNFKAHERAIGAGLRAAMDRIGEITRAKPLGVAEIVADTRL